MFEKFSVRFEIEIWLIRLVSAHSAMRAVRLKVVLWKAVDLRMINSTLMSSTISGFTFSFVRFAIPFQVAKLESIEIKFGD